MIFIIALRGNVRGNHAGEMSERATSLSYVAFLAYAVARHSEHASLRDDELGLRALLLRIKLARTRPLQASFHRGNPLLSLS